jgi:hypothetical protein
MLYWSGYVFFIIGFLLIFVFDVASVTKIAGVAALVVGACLGWQARRYGKIRTQPDDKPASQISSSHQFAWVLFWTGCAVVVFIGSVALILIGNFSDTGISVIAWLSVLLASAPGAYLYLRYGRRPK